MLLQRMLGMKLFFDKYLTAALLIFLFVGLSVHFVRNSTTGVLGRDESVYVSLAKGHYAHTAIDAPIQSWLEAAKKGVINTNDPPGFFVFLHFWQYVSFSEIWMRLLPGLFFATGIICLIKIGYLLRLPPLMCVAFGFMPLANSTMIYHALELRCYGMEVCFNYLMFYFALKIILMIKENAPSCSKKWVILSLIAIGGLSSRFSFIISTCAMYAYLWLAIICRKKSEHFKNYVIHMSLSSLVVFVFFLIFIGMKYHYLAHEPLNSIEIDAYPLAGSFMGKLINYINQFRFCFLRTMLTGINMTETAIWPLIKIMAAIVSLLIFGRIVSNFLDSNKRSKIKEDFLLYGSFFLFPLFSIAITLALAFVGLYPFVIYSRVSIYLIAIFHFPAIGLVKLAFSDWQGSREYLALTKLLICICLSISVIYGSYYLSHDLIYREGGAQHTAQVIRKVIPEWELKNIDYWYISIGEANSFKYHVLYGDLKEKISKRAKIIIENPTTGVGEGNIRRELRDIYKKAKPGSKVVMVLGHVGENAESYVNSFFKYFKFSKKTGEFIPSSRSGEDSLGGEQAFFAVR